MRKITAFLVACSLFLTMGCTQPKATTVSKSPTKPDTKAVEPTKAEEKKPEEKKPEEKKPEEKKPEEKKPDTPPAPPK
jgi:hypothetical protein